MHDSVREAWVAYNEGLEGKLNGLYADELGLVTTGMGNKVDPAEDALGLPWCLLPSWRPATNDEVLRAWSAVKHDPLAAKQGWRRAFALPENNVRLHDEAVDALIVSALDGFEAALRKRFPKFDEWPADAQMATLSMAWALGAAKLFKEFPKCCKALDKQDFAGAAAECKMQPDRGSLATRNKLNFTLFHNAADCLKEDGDVEELVWQP